MGESTNTVARLVKLLDENGFDVVSIQSGSADHNYGPYGDASLTVTDRRKVEEKAATK